MALIEETHDENRYIVEPEIRISTDYNKKILELEIELPGVDKKSIELKILPSGFHIKGIRSDLEYHTSYDFGIEVIPDKTTAKYENGLLTVKAAIRDPMDEAKIIEL